MPASQFATGWRWTTIALLMTIVSTGHVQGQTASAPDFLVTTPSGYDFDETVSRLKQSIEAENLMVIHEINPQRMLRMVGVRVGGMRQILFFHPRYMKQIVEANRIGGIEPPLKILVMEMPNGRVMVRYEQPEHQLSPYDGLESIAEELQGVVERIVATIVQ